MSWEACPDVASCKTGVFLWINCRPFIFCMGAVPVFFMDWNHAGTCDGMARYLASFANDYRPDIKAFVVISANWESPTIKVTGSRQPELIYDYHGFPAHAYDLKWPAPGAPELARQAVDMLSAGGITAELD